MTKPLSARVKGFILGLINLVVVTAAIAVTTWNSSHEASDIAVDDAIQTFTWTWMIAFLPSLITGAFVGWIAGNIAHRHRAIRLAILVPIPVGIVAAMGAGLGMNEFILPSCIPTLVAVLVLERWTRARIANPLPEVRIALEHRSD